MRPTEFRNAGGGFWLWFFQALRPAMNVRLLSSLLRAVTLVALAFRSQGKAPLSSLFASATTSADETATVARWRFAHSATIRAFQHRLIAVPEAWSRFAGRRTRDPYAILVSEIMLQQTQVQRPPYTIKKFLQRYPTIERTCSCR